MNKKRSQDWWLAFDAFCRKLLRSVGDEEKSEVHETVVGLIERRLIQLALQECEGNQVAAARLLGVHRNTLRRKIRRQ